MAEYRSESERGYILVSLEVAGIQKYITSTGKLKEMIGASEIIHYICQQEFLKDIFSQLELKPAEKPEQTSRWCDSAE